MCVGGKGRKGDGNPPPLPVWAKFSLKSQNCRVFWAVLGYGGLENSGSLIWRTVGSLHCPSRGQWAGLAILARLCAAGGPTRRAPCPPAW
eukprot:1178483-Prorocentrum_minimum.AAC.5